MSELKEIRKIFKEMGEIKDPIDRINKVIEYMMALPINMINVPIFILNELKKLWELHKDLI